MTHIMKVFEFDDFLWICMNLMIFFWILWILSNVYEFDELNATPHSTIL